MNTSLNQRNALLPARRGALLLCVLFVISGCSSLPADNDAFKAATAQIAAGKFEDGLSALQKIMLGHPQTKEYRAYYYRQRDAVINQLIAQGDARRLALDPDGAERIFMRVLDIDHNNVRASASIDGIKMDKRHDALLADAETLLKAGSTDAAAGKVRAVLNENTANRDALAIQRHIDEQRVRTSLASPFLRSALKKTVSLEFREASIRSIFEVISRVAEINFVFDKDVHPDLRATIFFKNSTIEDVVRSLLLTNQLAEKTINQNSILIYPNTPAKAREYQELVVKTFYLTNAEAKTAQNLLKSILKVRDIYVDDKLNLMVIRDTPAVIRLAEKLIRNQDLAEPEVVLEVEVMEIKRSRLTDIGVQWPTQFTVLNYANTNTVTSNAGTVVATTPTFSTGPLTLDTLRNVNSSRIGISPVILNLRQDNSDTNLLANPRIRVKNREKAKIHIGDRVPVITTTATANVGISESVQYLDIGLRLDVEPTVNLNDDVGIKVGLEVSSIVREIKSGNGTLTYQIGTRSASTNLRLKDGETQALAGLISDEDRRTATGLPGLIDLPIIGRLFSSERKDGTKTEIVLLITPRIVRNLVRPGADSMEFSSGTEASTGASVGGSAPTSSAATASTQPAVQPSVSGGAAPAPSSSGRRFQIQR